MNQQTARPLTLESLLSDPLTRLVNDADGVTIAEFAAVLYAARDAVVARGPFPTRVPPMPLATNARA
jgi:hypothetical protein